MMDVSRQISDLQMSMTLSPNDIIS